MSDLGHLQERLRCAAGPDERFDIIIGERFIRDGQGGHTGKVPDIYIMRYQFQAFHEIGTGKCIATGASIEQAMARFETWLKASPDPTRT